MGIVLGTLVAGAGSPGTAATAPRDRIASGFRDVPMAARLRMFWRVFGPAWESGEIERELTLLRDAGVGGVMTCFTYPVALDDPAHGIRNQRFLSPEFLATLGHAAATAQRLGLEFGVCGGTGWPYGGPPVSLADAAHRLRVEPAIPRPDGSGYALPPLREGERYLAAFVGTRDVTDAILGEKTSGQDSPPASLETRRHGERHGEPPGLSPCLRVSSERSERVVNLPFPTAEALRVCIAGPTRMQVKRAALGGEGYVVDHYSAAAVKRYLEAVVAPMLRAVPQGSLRTLFCDSLEVYRANWTHDFPEQFRRQRGYDLLPRLPELFDEAAPARLDLRFDYWRTLAELAEAAFVKPVHDWCRKHRVAFALEPYGTPPLGFTAARFCDVPWGEQYEWKGFSFSRFTSSAAHLAGKKIIGAEAWTWTGIPNRLADSLSDLKLCSDLHFLAGSNELTGVDFPYSPPAAGAPGWTPYYGPVLNENNPQWLCFPDFAAYVSRCQWLLRQGRPVADVALYVPTEDVFARGPTEQMLLDFHLRDRFATGELTDEFGLEKALRHHSDLIHTLLTHGYNFDGIDFFAMRALARVRLPRPRREGTRRALARAAASDSGGRPPQSPDCGGVRGSEPARLIAGDGRYAVVVLPNLEGMELAALRKIARFCRAGGTVIATRRLPDRVYGARSREETPRLRALIAAMFGVTRAEATRTHPYGKGKTIFTPDEREGFAAALAQGIAPDLRVSPYHAEVSHVHRRAGNREFYFVVNVGATEARFTADCRVPAARASLWDPMGGEISPLPIRSRDAGRTQVELRLPPRGSTFVCFERNSTNDRPTTNDQRRATAGCLRRPPVQRRAEYACHDANVGRWSPFVGRWSFVVGRSSLVVPCWRVTYDGPDAPPPHEAETLISWTEWPGARYFSGRATYRGTFQLPEAVNLPLPLNERKRCFLRFEQVREVAVVVVNGQRAGAIWTPPHEVEVGRFLRPGENTLEITVANLPVNRVLGLPDPDLAPLRAVYGDRFPAPEEKRLMAAPAPSGLIGRIELAIEEANATEGTTREHR